MEVEPRVEGVAQAVADEVEAGHGERDGEPGEDGEPGGRGQVLLELLSMLPQLGSGGWMP